MSNKTWLNSSSYVPKVIKKHVKQEESVSFQIKPRDHETDLPPEVTEHVFKKSLPVLQRFLEPIPPFIELDPNRLLMVTLSTIIFMAQGKEIPKGNKIWTETYLKCIRDCQGNVPPNIQLILDLLEFDPNAKINTHHDILLND